jgi:putative serine protease PepD
VDRETFETTGYPSRRRRSVARAVIGAALASIFVVVVAACGGGASSTARARAEPAISLRTAGPESLQKTFVETIRAVGSSVVQIQTPVGLGSGIVLDGEGNIVTNDHVVGPYEQFRVTDSSGRQYSATLVGAFPPDDLAVVHVEGGNLQAAALGDSSKLQVGDLVLAVGNPLGLQSSVTSGIVSALGRTISEQGGVALPDLIQTSAPINPGNSGGALVDLEGRVVGIPTLAAIDPENSQQANGIGFAIPSNTVKQIAGQIIHHGRVVRSNRAYLGVRLATLLMGGVVVAGVSHAGPAAKAGVVAGDTIETIDGQAVRSLDDVATLLADTEPGRKVNVRLRTRHGKQQTVVVTLGQYPGS